MPNVGGPSTCKRALLGTVVNSKLLYASPTWASRATKTAKNRDTMARAQQTVALRITRAYRTVSTVGASVLASIVPADLLAIERGRIRRRLDDQSNETDITTLRKQERAITIVAWQARWDRASTARWTHRLLPDLSLWLEKPPLNMTFRLTQALSGHGCFKQYLQKMNRAEDSYCVYCVDPNDTVEHTLFVCPRWLDNRSRMTEILRRNPTPEDVQEILCGPRLQDLPTDTISRSRLLEQAMVNRRELINMMETIISIKEEDEREDQADDRRRAHGLAA